MPKITGQEQTVVEATTPPAPTPVDTATAEVRKEIKERTQQPEAGDGKVVIDDPNVHPQDKPDKLPEPRFDWKSLGNRVRVREGQGVVCVDIAKSVAEHIGSHYGQYDFVRVAFNPDGEISVSIVNEK